MIKVEHTKKHCITFIVPNASNPERFEDILVTDAELVLVECKPEEALIVFSKPDLNAVPILISRTEKIEVGDWFYSEDSKQIFQHKEGDGFIINYKCFKILALPEHFSPEQLQLIVDGMLKEDKLIVECQEWNQIKALTKHNSLYCSIKLNSSNHIILHSVEEKMYSEKRVLQLISWMQRTQSWKAHSVAPPVLGMFEREVK